MIYSDGKRLLSDVVYYRTYAGTKSDGTKESWEECVTRVMAMHKPRIPTQEIFDLITEQMLKKAVMPAMRSLQFAGEGILRENTRLYNCSYQPIVDFQSFAEGFFILMCGTGWGYSVRREHVEQLPVLDVMNYDPSVIYTVPDTKEGWADSVRVLCENAYVKFDYGQIRPAGSPISTGGTASGPEALKIMHEKVRLILLASLGRRLSPLNVFDICCHVSDAVVVGGVRRAATIALFDHDEEPMLAAKSGAWWELNPQRARANISVAAVKSQLTKAQFDNVLERCFASQAGEPGLYFVEHDDWGTQPCGELALEPYQFCNLVDVDAASIHRPKAIKAAAYLSVLQATYTNFGYLRPEWKATANRVGLVGVGLTGIAKDWDSVKMGLESGIDVLLGYFAEEAAKYFKMPVSPRVGCVKPSGSSSAFLGTTSGIHAGFDDYYIRRVRLDKTLPITQYFMLELADFMEDDAFNPGVSILSVPCQGEGVMRGDETAVGLLKRSKLVYDTWIKGSHRSGEATHNVSITVNYHEHEKEPIAAWMWENRDSYNGISLLPYDGGSYKQAPFEKISKERYLELKKKMEATDLNLKALVWTSADQRTQESSCVGASCEII